MSVVDQVMVWVQRQHDVASLQSWFETNAHHGCFCGAGQDCDEPVDGLDECCQEHDAGYGSVGLSSATMWQIPDGFTKARPADARLVECARSAETSATIFREGLIAVFEARVRIADAIIKYERLRRWILSDASTQTLEQRQAEYASIADELSHEGVQGDELVALVHQQGVDLWGHSDGSGDLIA